MKHVVITGPTAGIGRACAMSLAALGAARWQISHAGPVREAWTLIGLTADPGVLWVSGTVSDAGANLDTDTQLTAATIGRAARRHLDIRPGDLRTIIRITDSALACIFDADTRGNIQREYAIIKRRGRRVVILNNIVKFIANAAALRGLQHNIQTTTTVGENGGLYLPLLWLWWRR